jgi:hypothetical protein
MPPPPNPFAPDTYSTWHNATFPGDAPLPEKVEKLRADLLADSRNPLTALVQILTYTVNYCSVEYQQAAKTPTDYIFSEGFYETSLKMPERWNRQAPG